MSTYDSAFFLVRIYEFSYHEMSKRMLPRYAGDDSASRMVKISWILSCQCSRNNRWA